MGLLNKAKLAAKLMAVKGRVRDLRLEPLQKVKPLEQESIASQRSLERSTQDGKKAQIRLPPATLPRLPSPLEPGASRIGSVKARVVGFRPMINAKNAQEAVRLTKWNARSWASSIKQSDYGTIENLRNLLGLPPLYTSHSVSTTSALPEDALMVSFDTETEIHGGRDVVVEIGLTVLDTRDIVNTAPGPYAIDWIAKAKTYHYVVDITHRPRMRMRSCYFSDDMFADVYSVRSHFLELLQKLANPPCDPNQKVGRGPRKVVLVGHSGWGDLDQMRHSPGLELDLFSQEAFPTKPTMAFDTWMFTDTAIQQGVAIPSAKLGRLASWLGIPEQYRQDNGSSIGCHNAGNDAAYTMMALLIYAVRWESIIFGKTTLQCFQDAEKWRALRSASELAAFRRSKEVMAWEVKKNFAEQAHS
jgi:hypothetical protein